ncbi:MULTISPECIES: hypothetical protein [Oceanobacillus]|uniref:Uncharacterized protein n=1 Tax=Oceanobacillus aidingensis TaxID=645964 RepID=A0ABV9JUM4_9BACI|nr:hypothetical protein [Oceanobacillus oncorhynchi]
MRERVIATTVLIDRVIAGLNAVRGMNDEISSEVYTEFSKK